LVAAGAAQHAVALSQCPGYRATNVLQADSYMVADLTLGSGNCSYTASDSRLHVKIEDADYNIFQLQNDVLPRPATANATASSALLQFGLTKDPFSFNVTRASTGEVLFDTSAAALIFESQYVRLRTRLPNNPNLYGLGEHSDDFRLQTSAYQRTMWNAESPFIPRGQNLYGSHPVYFDHRTDGTTHGVFLLSASGMDINIDTNTTTNESYLEYNTIGGVLDFYFLAGPEPAAVSRQYAEVVGLPAMMPYWSLGFHQCKYGWPSVDYVSQVVANYSAANIPLETVWSDIDHMDAHQDFTTDPVNYPLDKMQALISQLHGNDQHFVMILDPGIHYDGNYSTYVRGIQKDVFLKAADGSPYRGQQWAGTVVWPDWFAGGTQDWWTAEINTFFDPHSGLDVDGLWTDMDEASNMCPDTTCDPPGAAPFSGRAATAVPAPSGSEKGLSGRNLFSPGYKINNHRGDISDYTLWTNITNADGTVQYDTHNVYGAMMAGATRAALLARSPRKRPFVLTRSTFSGAGRMAAHWFGDNDSDWDDYRITIKQMLAFASMHAMPMVGSDVCGFNGQAQEHMCARWATLGAFQPFYRNHADISATPQEFYRWASVADAARRAIDARYRLLDYMYTALWKASTGGDPMVNPLWFAFPHDANTFGIQTQWLLGEGLLVSPVIDDEATSVDIYLADEMWYDFWTHEAVRGNGSTVTVSDVGWSDIPVHIKGGAILPLRVKSGNTTAEVRKQDFTILVAPDVNNRAQGSLYLDDGESLYVDQMSDITFSWDGRNFKANGTFGYNTDVVVESVVVLGSGNGTEHKGPWPLTEGFEF
ncbi:putative alpha/beta-glucosidase agdC, partial [Diplogelasinospora grovesii]